MERYKKGKHVYTRWDKRSTQVTALPRYKRPDGVPLTIEPPLPDARPANEFVVHHRAGEVVIDFISVQGAKGRVTGRVIMTPPAARRFLAALQRECHD